MKAVKLYKIQWNLEGLTNEEKEKALETLPEVKGFTTQDDKFDVTERVPKLLKKKYGYDIIDFAFEELRVVNTIEDLLLLCAPSNEKVKKLFKNSGSLSSYGETCFNYLEAYVRDRIHKEAHGEDSWAMPAILDEVMIGVEKVTGMEWEGHSANELMSAVVEKIHSANTVNLFDKYSEALESEEDEDDEE